MNYKYEWMDVFEECVDGWIDEWMIGWKDWWMGWMDG